MTTPNPNVFEDFARGLTSIDKLPERSLRVVGEPSYRDFFSLRWIDRPSADVAERQQSGKPDYRIDHLESTIRDLRKELASCKKQIDHLCADADDRTSFRQTQIMDISEKYEVTQPIPIVLEESRNQVVARFPEVELFAIRATESEAILQLKEEIIELFSELTTTPKEKLGKLPLGWLRILSKVMKPVG